MFTKLECTALGVAIEAAMGSFRNWTDWSWPRHARPIGGTCVKIILGRGGLLVGVACVFLGAVSLV
jgi:hypothetical protein